MKRQPLVAANWKMHTPPTGWDAPDSPYRQKKDAVDVVVFPTLIDMGNSVSAGLTTGAQYGHPESEGAFTGDVSMTMLAKLGCRYVLCGHSERRHHHHETNEMVALQVASAIDAGLTPILCIGETADERELDEQEEVVNRQLSSALEVFGSKLKDESCLLAYEPVWAIGNGKTASAEDAQQMHAYIRSILPANIQDGARILYGGSVKPENAAELIAQKDIDGFLIGGASLKPKEFAQIVDAAAVGL